MTTHDTIDPIDPALADLLAAERGIPTADAAVRDRLRARLDDASAGSTPWAGAADGPIDLAARRKRVARRALLGGSVAALAAAAAVVFGVGRGGSADPTVGPPASVPSAARPGADAPTPRKGGLELRIVDNDSAFMTELTSNAVADHRAGQLGIVARRDRWMNGDTAYDDAYLLATGVDDGKRALATYLSEVAARNPALRPGDDHLVLVERLDTPPDQPAQWRTVYVHRRVELAGNRVREATVNVNEELGQPELMVTFDDVGARRFAEITRANIGRKLAITVDDQVIMAPVVRSAIEGGRVSITLGAPAATMHERALDLADKILGRR